MPTPSSARCSRQDFLTVHLSFMGKQIAQVAEKSFLVLSLVEILSMQIGVGADGAIRGRRH
jgi:hypothetical protein